MARRSDHSRDELASLVLDAATALAAQHGLRGVTMRSIAARIGYAPGSIYNATGDLDAVLMRVKAHALHRLSDHVEHTLQGSDPDPMARALAVAQAYLVFVADNARLWTVLFEHRMPEGAPNPAWFTEARARPIGIVDTVLTPFFPAAPARLRATTALWAALQGVAALTVAGNLNAADPQASPFATARSIVHRYLTGTDAE